MKRTFSKESTRPRSSTSRTGKTFLMKTAANAKSFMCTELNFDQTSECPRVIRLQDYLCGIEVLSEDERYQLCGNQPVFYLQERLREEGNGYEWNGFILYRTGEKELARQVALTHTEELGIILAYESPLDGKYYLLVKTLAKRFDECKRRHYCHKHKARLNRYLPSVQWLPTEYFVRAFSQEHYDVIDRDALFGKARGENRVEERSRGIRTAGGIIRFFSHLLHHIA